MKYRIVSVIFPDLGGHGDFERLCDAFEASVEMNGGDCELLLLETERPDTGVGARTYIENTVKLNLWIKELAKADMPTVFMDCDTIVLRPLVDAFDQPFDVAITTRDSDCWFNAGVVFARPGLGATRFFQEWQRVNDDLYANQDKLAEPARTFVGINQSALSLMLKAPPACDIAYLPCETWNNVDQTWDALSGDTAVLHIKGALRELCLVDMPEHRVPPEIRPARDVFRVYDRIAREMTCA